MATATRTFPHPDPTDENDAPTAASTTTSTATAATTKSAPNALSKPASHTSMATSSTSTHSARTHIAPTHASKRALGDITNAARTHVQPASFKSQGNGAGRRRASARRKTGALAAVTKSMASRSPMSTSTAPRRTSDRLAERAAAAVAAASTQVIQEEGMEEYSGVRTACGRVLPSGVSDIDAAEMGVAIQEAQVAISIHDAFVEREEMYMADAKYMTMQTDITIKMRAILVDWLVDVHSKFKLRPETLFLTVNIIDRYLSCTPVMRRKLQLVGVTAMLIASKYEEIYSPEISDFVYISDRAYTKKEIIAMEATILNELNFEVTLPYSLTFMKRAVKSCESSLGSSIATQLHLAQYIVELALPSSDMLQFRPSIIGAAASSLAGKLTRRSFRWNDTMRFYSGGWSVKELSKCENVLRLLLEHEIDVSGSNKLTAVKRKFSSPKFCNVAAKVATLMDGFLDSDMEICSSAE